jgi:hypothetical protein
VILSLRLVTFVLLRKGKAFCALPVPEMSSGAAPAAAAAAGPKLQHAIRSKTGVAAFWGPASVDGVTKVDGFSGYVPLFACVHLSTTPTFTITHITYNRSNWLI